MGKRPATVSAILEKLEKIYGEQKAWWPTHPYEFVVWWLCGYPASDERCAKGWAGLNKDVGIAPDALLDASPKRLAAALKAGGMVPELRAVRLKEIAARVKNEFNGDLLAALIGSPGNARKALKKFPNIGDPGADRILLFAGLSPIAAIPSNCPQVLIRILSGKEPKNYGANYRDAQTAIATELPETFEARTRAYLLLKRHGQETCKAAIPRCAACPVNADCAFYPGTRK